MDALAREQIATAILDLAATHPHYTAGTSTGFTVERSLHGTHWENCWKSHPECALVIAAGMVRGDT